MDPSIHPYIGTQAPMALPLLPGQSQAGEALTPPAAPVPPHAPAAVFRSSECTAEGINPDNSTSEMM